MIIAFAYTSIAIDSFCSTETLKACAIDEQVGTTVIYEDDVVKVWNFTLAPGETTSMHRHGCDYHFVAIEPTELEVFSETGERLFSFQAKGTLGFKIVGDNLEQLRPTGVPVSEFIPIRVPRTHAARNIGPYAYYEILYESKLKCISDVNLNVGS